VKEFGKIDILVNNAGIVRRADALEFSEEDWDDVLSINLKTVFFLCQAAARQFVKQNTPGKIINFLESGLIISLFLFSLNFFN